MRFVDRVKNRDRDLVAGITKGETIRETELIKAEMLDVVGFDAEKIVEKIINEDIGHLLDGG